MTREAHSAADDLLSGAAAIAKAKGRTVRWIRKNKHKLAGVFYNEQGLLCAFKSVLEAHEQARAKELDELRARMTAEAAKAAPVIAQRRTARGRKPGQQPRRKRARTNTNTAVA